MGWARAYFAALIGPSAISFSLHFALRLGVSSFFFLIRLKHLSMSWADEGNAFARRTLH